MLISFLCHLKMLVYVKICKLLKQIHFLLMEFTSRSMHTRSFFSSSSFIFICDCNGVNGDNPLVVKGHWQPIQLEWK
jgi:hypothetical protein